MKTLEQLGISPAPWKQGEWVPYCENNIVRCDYHRKDGTPSTRIVAECNATFSSEQARVDARLIAAAPDLYEALRECVGEMCKFCKETEIGKSLPCEMGCEIMRRARAALEKAGGEA